MATGKITEGQTKSAFNSRKLGKAIGDFQIHSLRIISPLRRELRGDNSVLDLQTRESPGAWTEINFYEAIEKPYVYGNITILDTVGIVEALPILGEEILEIRFSTAGSTPQLIEPDATISGSTEDRIITNRFRIYKVDPPVTLTDSSRRITLKFISDLEMKNIQTVVQKSYNATSFKPITISDIVRKIYYESFVSTSKQNVGYEGTKKELLVEPTSGLYSVHIPNWNPFHAIKFLARKAISTDKNSSGANFMFFETLKGFRFISMETLMRGGFKRFTQLIKGEEVKARFPEYAEHTSKIKKPYIPFFSDEMTETVDGKPEFAATYTYRPANIDDDEYAKRFAMTNFRLKTSVNTRENTMRGMYTNRVISHDLLSMSVYRRNYFYKEQKDTISVDVEGTRTIVDNKHKTPEDTEVDINDFTTAENGAICSEYADYLNSPESHISLFPTNRGVDSKFGEGPTKTTIRNSEGELIPNLNVKTNTPDGKPPTAFPIETDRNVEKVLGKRISQLSQYNVIQVSFTAPGDSAREVGDLIYISYPSEKSENYETGTLREHKYLSGKYLITALRHKITQNEYEIVVDASKDSYLSEPSVNFEANIPKTQTPDGTDYVEEGR